MITEIRSNTNHFEKEQTQIGDLLVCSKQTIKKDTQENETNS